jgi:preprotein translocase subunit YajC
MGSGPCQMPEQSMSSSRPKAGKRSTDAMPNATDTVSLLLAQTGTPTVPSEQIITTGAAAAPGGSTSGVPVVTTTGAAPAGGPAGPQSNPISLMLPIFVVVGVMLVMTTLTGRKEKKKKASLLAAMGKGDKVITIGGQIGVVDQVRENEVVLRIDENSNAKARFTKASIQQILESAGGAFSEADSGSNGTIEVKAKGDKVFAAR